MQTVFSKKEEQGEMKPEYPLTNLEMLTAIIAEPGRIAEDDAPEVIREQYRVNVGSLQVRRPGFDWRTCLFTPDACRYRLLPLPEPTIEEAWNAGFTNGMSSHTGGPYYGTCAEWLMRRAATGAANTNRPHRERNETMFKVRRRDERTKL